MSKSEGRRKAEGRNPKPKEQRAWLRYRDVPDGQNTCAFYFWISEFGLRPSFGLRISAFGFFSLTTMSSKITGILTPHMVPLDAGGQINEAELRRYVDWL